MKKRLLSLLLCLVMVFSLLPMGSLAVTTTDNVKVDDEYVYQKTGTDTVSAGDPVPTGEYYTYVNGEYVSVTFQTGTVYEYTESGKTQWNAKNDIGTSTAYYFNDGTGYYPVKAVRGTLDYTKAYDAGKDIGNWLLGSSTNWSDDWYTKKNAGDYYVYDATYDDAFYVIIREEGHVGGYYERFFYLPDYSPKITENNVGNYVKHSTGMVSSADPALEAFKKNQHVDIPVSGENTENGVQANITRSGLTGTGSVNSSNHYFDAAVYTHTSTTGYNAIYYTKNGTDIQLGKTIKVDADLQYAYKNENGPLYTRSEKQNVVTSVTVNGQTYSSEVYGQTLYSNPIYTRVGKLGDVQGYKSLEANGDAYDLTIDSWATGEYQKISDGQPSIPEKTPLDIALVIDQSGSMRTADLEGGNPVYTAVTESGANKTSWTLSELQNGTQYYYKVENKYYPVQLGTGNLFEGPKTVRGNETFGWGNDGISVLVNGAPTYYNVNTNYYILADTNNDGLQEMHRVRGITAGLDLHYGFYPYIYKDENNTYAKMGKWTDNHYWLRLISPWGGNKVRGNSRWNTIVAGGNNDSAALISFIDKNGKLLGATDSAFSSAKMSYSWISDTAYMKNLYKVNSRGYANLYYVNDNGEKVLIGNRNFSEDDFKTAGALYTVSGGTERVAALESAVSKFINAVKEDATETGNTVDHKIAIVGYAQDGKETSAAPYSSYVKGNNNPYTNTGTFKGSSFDNFTNYDDNPTYALQSVSDVTFSSETFGTWGGTYVAYGMDMAAQILATDTAKRNTSKGTAVSPKKVVIVFTDGEPGASGYEEAVANSALATSSKLSNDVEIYTIGLYPQSASSDGLNFLKRLSSEYSTGLTPLQGTMDPEKTYYIEDGNIYKSISTEYYGESAIGWWEYNTDTNSVRLMSVKGANAGAGEEYLYTDRNRSGETTGERADTSKRYYSANGYEAYYGYRWFDADMNMVDTTGLDVYTLSETRQSGGYSMTASTKAGLESIFTELAKTIQNNGSSSSNVISGDTVTAINYDSTNSIIRDVISDDFVLQNPTVTLQYVSATSDSSGNITEGSASAAPSTIAYDLNDKTIEVTGFDFGANSIYNGHEGNILRVTITGLVPINTGTVYSNVEARSGIYAKDYSEKLFSYNNPPEDIPTFTVQWSVDDNIVEIDEGLARGEFPSYEGETPEKADGNNKTYIFIGWSSVSASDISGAKAVDKLPAVTDNITYYAVFREAEIKNYTVHWFNGDTELVEPTNYKSGEYPAYNGTEQPTREGEYFVGWSTNAGYEYDETTVEDNLYYGQKTVDQLVAGDSTTVNLYAIFAEKPGTLEVKEKNLVVEYSTKHEIDTNVYDFDVDVSSSSFGAFSKVLDKGDNPNGVGTLYFTANAVSDFGDKESGIDLSPLSGVNKATYYTGAPADSKEDRTVTTVTVVPASSMYLDDSLTEIVAQSNGNKFDYKAVLAGENASEESTTEFAKGETLTFTFSAERIDVYCTTDGTGNSVMASLKDTSGALAKDKNGNTVKAQLSGNKLTNGGTVYNTPTISFTNLDPSQTYVLTVKAMTAKYRFDGIRVYNPSRAEGTEISNVLSEANEQNARYQKVRDILLTDKTAFDALGEDEAAVVFVDRIAGGETTKDIFADYKDYGPKNEVYLQPNQGIAFSVDLSAYNNAKVYVGMSSQSTNGQVYVSGTNPAGDSARVRTDVKSATEQYYEVTPDKNNVVVIKNAETEGSNIISITNIKITGDLKSTESDSSPNVTAMFGARKMMLRSSLASFDNLDVVEENVTDEPVVVPGEEPSTEPSEDPGAEATEVPSDEPTEEPVVETQTPEPSPSATTDPNNGGSFSSAISKIIQSVTNTISKLFKSLFRW